MNLRRNTDGAVKNRLVEAREAGIPWKMRGPYLSERQWGTVRGDCSEIGMVLKWRQLATPFKSARLVVVARMIGRRKPLPSATALP